MRVRTKLTLMPLIPSLVTFFLVGFIAYRKGEQALREALGASFQRMAAEAMDKVDRSLYDVQQDVRTWAGLELMQEVVTGDLDGRISSFLIAVAKEYGTFARIDVTDDRADVVASSDPRPTELSFAGDENHLRALRGKPGVRDVHKDELSGQWVASFYYPIRARFDERRVIGAICARWSAAELYDMTEALQARDDLRNVRILLIRSDGLAVSTLSRGARDRYAGNLIQAGWTSAKQASEGGDGYLVEALGAGELYVTGFSHSRGHRDFPGLGWSTLALQDLESAFSPIEQLKFIVLVGGILATLTAVAFSLGMSRRLADPLMRMADAAKRVAHGDFETRVNYRADDEIGTLARVFDAMIEDVSRQRALLEEDIERRERAATELREAKEAAEESTTRFKAVLNTVAEGIVTVDSHGTIVMLNEEVGNIWGYRQDELLGRSVGMLLPAESRVRYRAAFETYLKVPVGERPEPRFSIEGLRKDGTVFPLEVTVAQTWFGERLLLTAAVRDITERVRAENQIKSALREKEALLKEIHHRVKNNLQVIVSLLYLQAAHLKDEQAFAAFRDSESRVKSMALLHEKLYRSKNLSKIDMSDYVQALTRDLFLTYRLGSPRIQLTLDIENIALGMDTALHCGLIINELASNSLKHAFPGESSGQLSVVLRDLGSGTYSLVVRDDGIGLPEGTLLGKRASSGLETIGLDLVLTLVEHLEGRLEVETEGGTTVKIVFKDVDADQPETVVA